MSLEGKPILAAGPGGDAARLVIGKYLKAGGEGQVYKLGKDECAKIFSDRIRSDSGALGVRLEKVSSMIQAPPQDPMRGEGHHSIAWPKRALFFAEPRSPKTFAGFTMPLIRLDKALTLAELHLDSHGAAERQKGVTWEHYVRIASNLSTSVAAVHEAGYCIGDFNANNVMAFPDGCLVCLIDCDSFQVRDRATSKMFRCTVRQAEEGYCAPEEIKANCSAQDATTHGDAFALAVHVFQLLMLGTHPFACKYTGPGDAPTLAENIKNGRFVHPVPEPRFSPPPHALRFDILPPSLRTPFVASFIEGARNPKSRSSAAEWAQHLTRMLGELEHCRKNRRHVYSRHLSECPWCDWRDRKGQDPFPSGAGRQVRMGLAPGVDQWQGAVDALRGNISVALADRILTKAEWLDIQKRAAAMGIPKPEARRLVQEQMAIQGARYAESAPGAEAQPTRQAKAYCVHCEACDDETVATDKSIPKGIWCRGCRIVRPVNGRIDAFAADEIGHRFAAAAKVLSAGSARKPDDWRLIWARALNVHAQGNFRQAIQDLTFVLLMSPALVDVWADRAHVNFCAGDFATAKKDATIAVTRAGGLPHIQAEMTGVLAALEAPPTHGVSIRLVPIPPRARVGVPRPGILSICPKCRGVFVMETDAPLCSLCEPDQRGNAIPPAFASPPPRPLRRTRRTSPRGGYGWS